MLIQSYLSRFPLIAIFRGVTPEQVISIATEVVNAGFQILEVPLNSPRPLESIALLAERFPDLLVGGGTVMSPADVLGIAQAGGKLVLMPHSDPAVVRQAKQSGLLCVPGVATPTEAFTALANGADALKLYPAEQIGPDVLKAWRAVLPEGCCLLPVGGIRPDTMEGYLRAGAQGFGLGSALYKAGMSAEEVARNARAFQAAISRFRVEGLLKSDQG